jgi:hypothetical protein
LQGRTPLRDRPTKGRSVLLDRHRTQWARVLRAELIATRRNALAKTSNERLPGQTELVLVRFSSLDQKRLTRTTAGAYFDHPQLAFINLPRISKRVPYRPTAGLVDGSNYRVARGKPVLPDALRTIQVKQRL